MINKKRGTLLFSICLFVIISGYFYFQNRDVFNNLEGSKKTIPNYMIDKINETRTVSKFDKEDVIFEFSKLMYNFQDFNDELTDEDILVSDLSKSMNLYVDIKDVTINKAISDIDHFFKLLKYGYAGYEFFGGDETFMEAKMNMLKEIKEHSENISTEEFNQIILRNLDFIQDGHFAVGKYRTAKDYVYYSSEKYELFKDSKGYYTKIDEKKYYISFKEDSISENDLKLSINKDGEIVYYIGYLSDSTDEYEYKDIELRSNNNYIRENIKFTRYRRDTNFDRSNIYKYSTIGEIPVIEIRSMLANTQNQLIQLNKFREHAAILKDKDLFIIDIRGNGGGSDSYCKDWISTYTGQEINVGGNVNSELWTRTTIKGIEEAIKIHEDESIKNWVSKIIEDVKNSSIYPGWSDINYKEQYTIENSNLIIVIMDKGVASSGETFIEILRSMENVIFVGVNTSGMSLVGDNILYILPNSNMPVYFGKNLDLNIDLENVDGKGFFPDLWINSNDSIDRVFKFIERYDMESLKKKSKI
ncbi:S41 family peptidase [Alkaliphilus sp. MSJ-5]|uniref:S41 family peptidase n=1 Tax=Alkaliphilus flagellatus TaxID=2841507 RepID=A0ABS6G8U2_9FIRM|nr:S41 family peptidase [Alkaliphilus flagellatus]MBU5677806.1 S41 family peptidase [Alkaliphilus flagellatus]